MLRVNTTVGVMMTLVTALFVYYNMIFERSYTQDLRSVVTKKVIKSNNMLDRQLVSLNLSVVALKRSINEKQDTMNKQIKELTELTTVVSSSKQIFELASKLEYWQSIRWIFLPNVENNSHAST